MGFIREAEASRSLRKSNGCVFHQSVRAYGAVSSYGFAFLGLRFACPGYFRFVPTGRRMQPDQAEKMNRRDSFVGCCHRQMG
jgi:hypothetical protein